MEKLKINILPLYKKKLKTKKLCDTISYLYSIQSKEYTDLFSLSKILSNHLNLLESIYKEENGRMFFRYTQPSLINMSTLIAMSSLNPLYTIRLCNEIIEDNINDLIRNLLEQDLNSKDTIMINKEFKSTLLKLRDEYKTCLPNEIIENDINDYKKSLIYKNQDVYIKTLASLL